MRVCVCVSGVLYVPRKGPNPALFNQSVIDPQYLPQKRQLTLFICKTLDVVTVQFQTVFWEETLIISFSKASDLASHHNTLCVFIIHENNCVLLFGIIFCRTNIMQNHIHYTILNYQAITENFIVRK